MVSGGEPTVVPGLSNLLQDLLDFGLPLKLDSNGLHPEVLKDLIQTDLVQAVAVDVKGPFAKYPALTGNRCTPQQAETALHQVFDLAGAYPHLFFFRCTAVPELTQEDLAHVQDLVPPGFEVSLQTYRPPQDFLL